MRFALIESDYEGYTEEQVKDIIANKAIAKAQRK